MVIDSLHSFINIVLIQTLSTEKYDLNVPEHLKLGYNFEHFSYFLLLIVTKLITDFIFSLYMNGLETAEIALIQLEIGLNQCN